MWFLEATQVIGIDRDSKRIDYIRRNPGLAFTVLAEDIPKLLNSGSWSGWTREYIEQFRGWWEDEVPHNIRGGIFPQFFAGDISSRQSILQPNDYFDLVYCRYVLDKIMDEDDEDKILSAIQNMASLVKPRVGRVVIVEPTQKKDSRYNFETFFSKAGMNLEKIQDKSGLGKLRWPETEPKGYIYMKP